MRVAGRRRRRLVLSPAFSVATDQLHNVVRGHARQWVPVIGTRRAEAVVRESKPSFYSALDWLLEAPRETPQTGMCGF